MRRLASIFVFALASGCASVETGKAEAIPPTPPSETASGERLDPFVLMINAGRMAVYTDRIKTALELSEGAPGIIEQEGPEGDIRRAANSIRQARFEYMALKSRACADGLLTEAACTPTPIPAWLSEPADAPVSAEEVERRTDELQVDMGPLLDVACDYGQAKSGDDMFCSVE